MKSVVLSPIKIPEANGTLSGKNFDDVADLPVTRFESVEGDRICNFTMSTWKASFWTRLKFLFSGKVNLLAMGQTHPPVSITLGEYFYDA